MQSKPPGHVQQVTLLLQALCGVYSHISYKADQK